MILFQDLSFIYDGKILFEHFSEVIQTGEKVVIGGASGSGKSTLLSCVAGFVSPGQGCVQVDDLLVDEHHLAVIREKLAWVPQEFSLPYQGVDEMVATIFHLKTNRKKMPSEQQILSAFAALGLSPEMYRKRLAEISGGQRQRVMLAIAGLLDKEILLLDEPTSALDPAAVDNVVHFLKEMKGKTVLAVSHDAKFINAFDRVIRL